MWSSSIVTDNFLYKYAGQTFANVLRGKMRYSKRQRWRIACKLSILAIVLAFSVHQFTSYYDLRRTEFCSPRDEASLHFVATTTIPSTTAPNIIRHRQAEMKFLPHITYPKIIPSAKQMLRRPHRRLQHIISTPATKYLSSPLSNQPHERRSIFMLETSGKSMVTPRQACAVESAAWENPNMDVVLYMTTSNVNLTDSYMKALASIPNVRFVQLDLDKLFIGSRLESWYLGNQWRKSLYNISHLSDAIRFLMLYQKGGIYMDLDVVVIKSVHDLQNCAGMEDDVWVAAGVMAFDKHHFFLKLCLEEFAFHYDGKRWGFNGPELVTRVLKRVCGGITHVDDISRHRCQGVTALPPQAFYAIPWQRWKDFFDEEDPDKVIDEWKDSYLIHVWNTFSSTTKVIIGSKQPYEIAASTYCPLTYKLATKKGSF